MWKELLLIIPAFVMQARLSMAMWLGQLRDLLVLQLQVQLRGLRNLQLQLQLLQLMQPPIVQPQLLQQPLQLQLHLQFALQLHLKLQQRLRLQARHAHAADTTPTAGQRRLA